MEPETVNDLLAKAGLTASKAASAAGIARRTLFDACRGRMPRPKTQGALAAVLAGGDLARLQAAIAASVPATAAP